MVTKMDNPSVTICIVNYNGLRYLGRCLESIKKSNYPFEKMETIMVDNASSDGSVDYVMASYPWVRVLEMDKNYGFAKANNIGARHAKSRYIEFLNNDTVVAPDWLDKLVEVMEKDSDIGVAGSKIVFLDCPGKINSAGGRIIFNGAGYDVGFMEDDAKKYNLASHRGYVCAAAMMVQREEFLSLGGFDENYYMYLEDVDLCWRYWLLGKKVIYIPGSIVYHKFSGTAGTPRHVQLKLFYGTRNPLLNVIKNFENSNIFFPLFLSFFYHVLLYFYFIGKRKFSLARLIVKAYGSFLELLPMAIAMRKMIQKRRRIKDRYLFDHTLIVSFWGSFKEFWCRLRSGKQRYLLGNIFS